MDIPEKCKKFVRYCPKCNVVLGLTKDLDYICPSCKEITKHDYYDQSPKRQAL